MIRGILLLILSCVVLTLQQSPCTCEQDAKPSVWEKADQTYPLTTDYGLENVKADAGYSDLLTKCNKLSSKTLFKDTTTTQFQALETDGKTAKKALDDELAKLKAQRDSIEKERKMVTDSINTDCRNLDYITETIYEPLPAIEHCTKSLYIRSRQDYCDKLLLKIDAIVSVKAAISLQYDKYITILGNCISLSKTIDNLVKVCPLGLCTRATVLVTLVADPLLLLVNNLINTLLNALADLSVKITAGVNLAPIVKVDVDLSLDATRVLLFENWKVCESLVGRPFVEIQAIIPNILHNPLAFLNLVLPLYNGYALGPNSQLICTGYNDPLSNEITLTLSTKIGLGVNANLLGLVSLDVNIAALKLAHICRVVTLALTATRYCDSKVLSVSVDGAVVIQISIPRDAHEMIQSVYQAPEIIQGCAIDSLTNKVNEVVLDEIQDTTTTIDELKSELERSISDCKSSEALVTANIGASLDGVVALAADVTITLQEVLSATLPDVLARLAIDRCVAHKTGQLDILKTVLSIAERTKLQILAKVSLCKMTLVQAKIDLDANVGNQLYADRYAKCHDAYVDALKAAIRIHVQIGAICDSINAQIAVKVGAIADIRASLGLNLDSIVSGVVKVLSALKVEILVKLNVILGYITDCITAFRPSCGILNLNFLNLDIDGDILLLVSLEDIPLVGETIDDLISCHKAIIRASVIASVGCRDVEVTVVVGSGNHYDYQCRIIQ